MKKSGEDRLKCVVYESTRAPLRGPLSPMRKAAKRGCGFSRIVKANARMCGKRITTDKAFPAWGRWRAERAGSGSSGMKKSGKDRLKYAVCESTRAPLARSPFPNGEGCDTRASLFSTQRLSQWGRQRGGGFAAKKKANPASLRSAAPSKGRGSRGYSLLPMEGGAPKGRRLDGDTAIPETQPSPRGEGGERSEPDRVLAV